MKAPLGDSGEREVAKDRCCANQRSGVVARPFGRVRAALAERGNETIECGDTEQSLNGLTVGPFGRGRSIDLGMKGAGSRLQSTARSGQMSWEVRDVFKFSR